MPGSGGDAAYSPGPKTYYERIAPYLANEALPQVLGYRYRVIDNGPDPEMSDEVRYELAELTVNDMHGVAWAVISAFEGAERVATRTTDGRHLEAHDYATWKMPDGPDYLAFHVYRQNRDEDDGLVYIVTVYIRRFRNLTLDSPVLGEMLVFSRNGPDKAPAFPSGEKPVTSALPAIELV